MMGGTLIFPGCLLWFAIAFNGGIGETIVNYSAFASGLFMVIAGIFTIVNGAAIYIRTFTILALIGYGAVQCSVKQSVGPC